MSMDRLRVEHLWARFVSDDALTEEERHELLEALSADDSLRATLFGDGELEGVLRAVGRSRSDAAQFARSCESRLSAKEDRVRFARDVWQRIQRQEVPAEGGSARPTRRKTRRTFLRPRSSLAQNPWVLGAAAAAVLLVLVAFLAQSPSPGASRPSADGGARPRVITAAGDGKTAERHAEVRRAEAERDRAERRLAELREQEAAKAREAEQAKGDDLARKAEQAFAEARAQREAAERKLAEATVAAKVARQDSRSPQEAPAKETPPPTRSSVATVERVEGEVLIVTGTEKVAARGGETLLGGQGLQTAGTKSGATLSCPDTTRIELAPETDLREFRAEGQKRVRLAQGTLTVYAAKQPKDQPMMFITPHGEAKVLGTTLRLHVDPDPKKGTWLEVKEGRVQLKRKSDDKVVEVTSGHFAVAAVGVDLAPKSSASLDEILLLPHQGVIKATEWRLVRDAGTAAGPALEAQKFPGPGAPPGVVFTFTADSAREYTVWVRGRAVVETEVQQAQMHDSMTLEFLEAAVTHPQKGAVSGALFDGYCLQPGYWWAGAEATTASVSSYSVRFSRPGQQTLWLHASESPMRVDTIWISATQKTRPKSTQIGPTPK